MCSVVSDSSVTPWTVACQAPLPMGFSRQEYWSGLPCPLPEDLPEPGIEPVSLMSLALAGKSLPPVPPGKPQVPYGLTRMIREPMELSEWPLILVYS